MESSRYIPETEVPEEQTNAALRKLLRESHGRERQLRNENDLLRLKLEHAYRAILRGFEFEVFDFTALRKEAMAWVEEQSTRDTE